MFPGGSQHAGHCYTDPEKPHAAFSLSWDHAYPGVMHASLGVRCLKAWVSWGAGFTMLVQIFSSASQVIASLG